MSIEIEKETEFSGDVESEEIENEIKTEETEENIDNKNDSLPDNWEPMVEKMATDKSNAHIIKLAKANPDFADYILEKTGFDVNEGNGKAKESSTKNNEENSYFDEMKSLKQKISEMEKKNKDRDTQETWNRVNNTIERDMKSDPFFDSMDLEFKKDVHAMIFQNYMISGNGGNVSKFSENMKKSLVGFKKNALSSYLKEKEDIQNTPVNSNLVMDHIKDKFKDVKFSPSSKEGRDSGLLGQMADSYWDKTIGKFKN